MEQKSLNMQVYEAKNEFMELINHQLQTLPIVVIDLMMENVMLEIKAHVNSAIALEKKQWEDKEEDEDAVSLHG